MSVQWKTVSQWTCPIQGRISSMLTHGDLLITHYLKELSFWDIKKGLENLELIKTLECEDGEKLRIFGDRLYVFAYYTIEVFDLKNLVKIEHIQFDRDLIIGSHSMQSYNHEGRCGAIVNDQLFFTFFNGVARMQDGSVKMLVDIEYQRFKLEKKDILFHKGILYVTDRQGGLRSFKVSGDELQLIQTIKKGYTPTNLWLHWDNSTLILVGESDFITFDISNPDKMVRHKSAKTNAELYGQIARFNDFYVCVGWTTSNKIQISSFEVHKDGPKLIDKQILKDYLPKEGNSNSDQIYGLVLKENKILIHTFYRGFGLFETN